MLRFTIFELDSHIGFLNLIRESGRWQGAVAAPEGAAPKISIALA
jgi:hypothetical protein